MISETSVWFVNLFVIINLSIIFIILWFRKNNVLSNRLFALVVFIPALTFLRNTFYFDHILDKYFFVLILASLSCLWAPILYWYVKLTLGMKLRFRKIDFVHFILFFLVLSYYTYLGLNPVERSHFFNALYDSNIKGPILNIIFAYAQLIQFFIYLIASIRLVRKSIIKERNYFSNEGITKARWLLELLILLFLLDIVCIVMYLVINNNLVEVFYIPVMYNLFYGYIVYQSFRHAAIFNQVVFIEYQKQIEPLLNFSENNLKSTAANKYSLLDKQKFDTYAERIILHFESYKPYLDPELNITKLSEQLAIPVHYISAVINEKMNKSFFDFVNRYRIEEVKQHLKNKEYEKFSLEAIGNNCGFNSRTSFFRVFKKHTGKTPNDYLKAL